MAKKQIDMTEGPILGRMILFPLPVLATGVLQLLFNASDLAVVGQFGGADSQIEVGAVGSCGALINLIVNLFMGLAVGAGVIAAQDIGAKRYEAVHKLADTALTVRAACFDVDGNRLGQVVTNTYVRAAAQDGIWTVMIAVPERDLDEITSRYNEKVEKPAHVEIVTPAGKRVISQDAGLRLFGGSSRTLEQKSFKEHEG